MAKSIVVYFARGDEEYGVGEVEVGNTELLAKEIVAKTGADEFKIIPAKPYPKGYMECVNLATEEKNKQARPEYVGEVDLKDYDTVFLGYPIWWGDLPMAMYTFIEGHDFAGKKVIPFNTHEGSGNSGTYEKLKNVLAGATLAGDGFNMSGTSARTDKGIKQVDDWLAGLGY